MSELFDLQCLHVELTAKLIDWTLAQGSYRLKWGETLRKQAQADANAAAGVGIKNSLHLVGLAVDFELLKDGDYLTDSKDYEFMGVYWESLNPLCRWGGRFGDGDHFSLTYEGIR